MIGRSRPRVGYTVFDCNGFNTDLPKEIEVIALCVMVSTQMR
jgi:hypothetical protein